ncbi:MAG: TonB-dependent receptor [Ferruginibacter sp.]
MNAFTKLPGVLRLLLLLLLFQQSVYAQSGQSIKGKVTDGSTGEPLAGATVSIEGSKINTVVNLDGSFIIKNILPGEYDILVEYSGYEKAGKNDVVVKAGMVVTENFQLKPVSRSLSAVTVVATRNAESDKTARTLEQRAEIVQNILSQKAIELSPDVTVANSLQRVSGVSIEKSSSGEGRYAIIRGMDQRYNNTLINGVKIPSPDDKFRYVPMDLFPSDLLERLEVIKSLTPSMEGDAIGGTMNLVMKNAPDKFKYNMYVAGGFTGLFSNSRPFMAFNREQISKKDPTELYGASYNATDADFTRKNLKYNNKNNPVNMQVGATIGNRFLHKKLGIILGVSFQDMYRGSDNIFVQQYAQPTYIQNLGGVNGVNYDNYPLFSDTYNRKYSTRQQRLGVNNKIDFLINDRNKLSLFNFYVHMNDFQTRYSIDSNVNTNPNVVSEFFRSRWQIQSIYNSTLQGNHRLGKHLSVNWSAVYSLAKQQVPDQAEYQVDNNYTAAPKLYTLKGMSRIWLHNQDQDLSGYLNALYNGKVMKRDFEISAGGMYRHKTRDNYYNRYDLSAKGTQTSLNGFDIDSVKYNFNTADGGLGSQANGNTYTVTENVAAGYVQLKFMATQKLQILGGARLENTDLTYNSALPLVRNAVKGHIWYYDILPSVHFKYQLSKKQNIRLSYFKSFVRPGFFEIAPYYIQTEYYDEQGNPYLKHTTADNFDLRYEWFPNGADQVLAGAFYKRIHNPIETGFERSLSTGGNSQPGTQILTPLNYGDATNYGFELVLTKFFGKVGINANYTYTHSVITTDRNYLFYNATTGRPDTKIFEQSRPLQGQAKHIGNISLLFKDSKLGLDAQLAYVYTGERITQVSLYYGLDSWQKPYSQLDFSLEWKFMKHFSFYTKINNLTNTRREVIIKVPDVLASTLNYRAGIYDTNPDHILIQRDIYKLNALFGFRFKF